ncbi:putative TOS1-like glycosyl hydrolase-domain-containing protein [Cercophora newfieldiana]|uniref:glucan endo-1,3-beta-D-glucosidase n=1 Tax=Cercophora newfieldiana TaxID=92897 RepID=A0AA39YSM3_9PEZI|nr:putative TOS1-like glycosyl hydrolase-domain-containing protein [Cercophora newfieldiana]
MKPPVIPALAVISTAHAVAIARGATSSDQLCAGKSFQENGNWYCQPVSHITYQDFGASGGEYQDVVHMDQRTGACEFKTRKFSGPLAPFNEPMYIHFRGPVRLKQVAVYLPSNDQRKREESSVVDKEKNENPEVNNHIPGQSHRHQHLHQQYHQHRHRHFHEKTPKVFKRACDPIQWVTATMDGQVVSWINDYCPGQQQAAPTPAPTSINSPPEPVPTPATTTKAALPPFPSPSHTAAGKAAHPSSPSFTRIAHYHAARQLSSGLTFLSNQGGSLSGHWTPTFGSTLSYVNASGTGPASSSQRLSDTLLPSSHEITLASSTPCTSTSCGYIQPGSVAYEGFPSVSGSRLILIDFSMPHAPLAGGGAQSDMPAIWLLNARIPLTGQYHACSCWKSGCGEFDVFETLSPGSDKAKSTFHSVFRGGDSNYFERPVKGTVRVVVGFDGEEGTVGFWVSV